MTARTSVTVRPERRADEEQVGELVEAAFPGEGVAELLADLRTTPAWLGLSFVAELRGAVVGHVAYSRAWLDALPRLVDVLVLSPLSVHPDRQRAGVGSALVRKSLTALEQREEPMVFLEGDPAYYRRLGFRAAGDLGCTAPSVRIPEQAFQVVTMPSYETWMGGALAYPDVFWRHDAVGLRDSAHA